MSRRPAIFLDRDGTLSHEVGYVNHPGRFRLYPWSVDAVRAINRASWLAVVVTNQAGVARGYFPESVFVEVQATLRREVEAGGARFDAVYACLHHPSVGEAPYREDCDCRKPRPGLLRRAESELGADLRRSWVVGDRYSDMQLAWSVGAQGALVKSGYGKGELTYLAPGWARQPDLVAENLLEAVERISREAPVLILRHDTTEVRLGGGANAVHNIRTLGARPLPFGLLGADAHGKRLRALLREKGISTRGVSNAPGYATPVKARILAGRAHSTKQQIVRLDRYAPLPAKSAARRALERALRAFRGPVDGVLVSDYGCGLLDKALVRAAVAFARARRIPVTVDSRFALLRFRGMTAVTPNEPEVEEALGVTIGHDRRRLEAAGSELLERLACRAVLVTRGSDGMALFERGRPPLHIPVFGSDQVADVTGAGDTVIATFTLALASGATPEEAARLANYAGGIVVMKHATATVSADELVAALREGARA